MDKRTAIIASAERIFEAEGFRGIGIDRIIAPSGVSTRTLYKHFGSRDGLVIAVLEARHLAFMAQLEDEAVPADPTGSLFDTLRRWVEVHGARGCLLLRAYHEYAEANEAIVGLVQRQKVAFQSEVTRRVQAALGQDDAELASQVWLLLEGATAAASVSRAAVIDDAKGAALVLQAGVKARRA